MVNSTETKELQLGLESPRVGEAIKINMTSLRDDGRLEIPVKKKHQFVAQGRTEPVIYVFWNAWEQLNSSKPTPAILVVPTDSDIRCLNVTPPFFKLFPAYVMRRGRH